MDDKSYITDEQVDSMYTRVLERLRAIVENPYGSYFGSQWLSRFEAATTIDEKRYVLSSLSRDLNDTIEAVISAVKKGEANRAD